MKKLSFLGILLFTFFLLNGQDWVRQYPFSEHETLYDIDFDAAGNGWAVGNNSLILHTANSGVLWTSQTSPVRGWRLEAVVTVPGTNGLKGFAGGDRLLQTADGGETWLEVDNSISSIRKIQAFDKNNIVVSGRTKVMRTGDGGANWTISPMPTKGANCAFFNDVNTGWVGTSNYNNAQVYMTTNGGQDWNMVNSDKHPVIAGFHFLDNNTGFMASRNWVLKTTDAGVTWDTLNPTKLPTITDIHVVDEQEIWVTMNNGAYLFTENGGGSWTQKSPNLNGSNTLKGIFVTGEGKVWATGNYTSVFYSDDRGNSWADQVPGQKGMMNKADFLTDKFGFTVGNEGVVLKTTDGGAIWEDLTFQDADSYFDVKVISQNEVIILSQHKILVSSNGGNSWTEKPTGAIGGHTAFFAKSASEIFITSKSGEILRTQNGGTSWDFVYNGTGYLSDIEFIDTQNAIVTGYNGLVLKSTDGGLTWNEKWRDNRNSFENIAFTGNLEGWIVASNYTDTIFRTQDGGETWTGENMGSKSFWHDITFMDADTGWVAGGSSGSGWILKTTDGGENWSRDYSGRLIFQFINAPIQNQKTIWAGGIGGNILKFSPCSTAPSITNFEGDLVPCSGDTIFYEVQQVGVDIFSWTVPGNWVVYGNSNTAKLEVIVGSDSGQITVKGANSCGDSTSILTLQVNPKTASNIEISEENEVLSTTTTNNVAGYEWLRYGEQVDGANNATFAPATGGEYQLRVTFNSGCIKYSNAVNVSITSADVLKQGELKLFPNPATDRLYLGIEPNLHAKIKIIDLVGVVHYSSVLTTSHIDVSNLREGIYFVTVNLNEEKLVSKLLIVR